MSACERCILVDALDAWHDYWQGLDLPIGMPDLAAPPFCPSCIANADEVVMLEWLITLLVDAQAMCQPYRPAAFEGSLERVEARQHDLLMAQGADDAA